MKHLTFAKARYDSRYDSRYGSHSYTIWTDGYIYRATLENGDTIGFAVLHSNESFTVNHKEFDKFMENAKWSTSSFVDCVLSDLCPVAQKLLYDAIGEENFPMEQSYWTSKEKFDEYFAPKTLKGVMSFLKRHDYFYNHPFESTYGYKSVFGDIFERDVKSSKIISRDGRGNRWHKITKVVQSNDGDYFVLTEHFHFQSGWQFEVKEISSVEALKLLQTA